MINFIKKHYVIVIIAISILVLLVRIPLFNYRSDDYILFLSNWFNNLKVNGGLKAIGTYTGDYNAPYVTILALLTYIPISSLYSIKIVSIIFDFVLAFSSAFLCKEIVKKNKDIVFVVTYAIVLFIPQVVVNSAMWAQCDSIYASFTILSLLFLLKEKYPLSFILLGLSFAFKLQFIFILPLYVILYFTKKKFSIFNFLLIPFMDIVLSLPAIIFGKSIKEIFLVYFNQTQTYKNLLVMNFPNIYNFIQGSPDVFYKIGVIVALLFCCLMLIYCIHYKIKWNSEKIITLGLYSIIMTTFLLPGMHERYLFVGEVLSVLYYIMYRKNIYIPIILIVTSAVTYTLYFTASTKNIVPFLSVFVLGLVLLFTKYIFSYLKGD